MFHWPMISTVFGVAANFFFLSVIATFSWMAYVLRSNDDLFSQSQNSRLSGKITAGQWKFSFIYHCCDGFVIELIISRL